MGITVFARFMSEIHLTGGFVLLNCSVILPDGNIKQRVPLLL